jgi:hypothetical protein
MLTGLQGDFLHLPQPGTIEDMLAGTTDPPITMGLITVMTIIFMVPIFYDFPIPDVEVSRESLDKPRHRHILCCV